MVDGIGTTKYTYSAAGQLLTEDGPFASDTVTNVYSNRLRAKLSLQQPTGVWTNGFGYDSTRRLTNVTSPAGAFGYVYDPALFTHYASLVTLPNTSYITNAFDGNARLIATYLKKSDTSDFDYYIYNYNPANQRTNLTRTDASTVAFKYDPFGQLKVADSSVNSEDRGYFYDAAWNLNRRTNNGVTSTFNVDLKNQLTADPSYSDVYDANGNLTQRNTAGTNNVYQYTYDDENRLVSILYHYGDVSFWWETDFVYDGLGRLRKRTEYAYGGGLSWLYTNAFVSYIYDGWRVIQERNYTDSSPLVSYTRGLDLIGTMERAGGIGGLLARSSGYSSGNWTSHAYYFADGNGNVTYMLNSSQAMVAKYRYDPFGNTISSIGTLASVNVYRFSSKEIHVNSGMYYYGRRFYDPNLQRWLNRDPINECGGYNLYGYVLNNPLRFIDPFGLDMNNGQLDCNPTLTLPPVPPIQDPFPELNPPSYPPLPPPFSDYPPDPNQPPTFHPPRQPDMWDTIGGFMSPGSGGWYGFVGLDPGSVGPPAVFPGAGPMGSGFGVKGGAGYGF